MPDEIILKLAPDQAKFNLQCIDTHVRANGLGAASAALVLMSKIQQAISLATAQEPGAEPRT